MPEQCSYFPLQFSADPNESTDYRDARQRNLIEVRPDARTNPEFLHCVPADALAAWAPLKFRSPKYKTCRLRENLRVRHFFLITANCRAVIHGGLADANAQGIEPV